MTDIGDTRGLVMIAEGYVGSVGSEYPDATKEILYLIAQGVGGSDNFPSSIQDLPTGLSYGVKDGTRGHSINLTGLLIRKFSTYTKTDSFNAIKEWLNEHHENGEPPLYLFIKNVPDGPATPTLSTSKYLKLSRNAAGATTRYMPGFVQNVNWEMGRGNAFVLKSLRFKECLS